MQITFNAFKCDKSKIGIDHGINFRPYNKCSKNCPHQLYQESFSYQDTISSRGSIICHLGSYQDRYTCKTTFGLHISKSLAWSLYMQHKITQVIMLNMVSLSLPFLL